MTTADRHTDLDPTVDRRRDGEGYDAEQAGGSHTADSYGTDNDTAGDAGGFGEREPSGYADRGADDQPADHSADHSANHYGDAVPSTDESHLDGTGQPTDDSAYSSSRSSVGDGTVADETVADPARTEGGLPADGDAGRTATTEAVPATNSGTTTSSTGTSSSGDTLERLVPADRVEAYTSRWDAVKGEFVDEPRRAVAQADKLVGELLDELDQAFRKQRSDLEHGLDADETSTEDLRLALRKYRSFFDRLLTL